VLGRSGVAARSGSRVAASGRQELPLAELAVVVLPGILAWLVVAELERRALEVPLLAHQAPIAALVFGSVRQGKAYIMRRGGGISLVGLVYIGVGVAIAATHHYFQHVHGWRGVLSAIFAIFLWPLVLLGINLHIRK
jgi:hypothetical protein